jgi:hypothetical protein
MEEFWRGRVDAILERKPRLLSTSIFDRLVRRGSSGRIRRWCVTSERCGARGSGVQPQRRFRSKLAWARKLKLTGLTGLTGLTVRTGRSAGAGTTTCGV